MFVLLVEFVKGVVDQVIDLDDSNLVVIGKLWKEKSMKKNVNVNGSIIFILAWSLSTGILGSL